MAANRSRLDDSGSVRGHGPLLQRVQVFVGAVHGREWGASMIWMWFAGMARSYGGVQAFVGAAHGRE